MNFIENQKNIQKSLLPPQPPVGKSEVGKAGTRENTQRVGKLGEDIACRYLEERGYEVIDRNYRKKWGEIDIVAKKKGIWHFVEVKAVSRLPTGQAGENRGGVSHETGYRPEENVHPKKLERLHRAIQSYLSEKRKEEDEWQLDVLAVEIHEKDKTATCRFLENII